MASEQIVFDDFLPVMGEKLGPEGLINELAKAFEILADPATQTITLASLRTNGHRLDLPQMTDQELRDMMYFGNSDGHEELSLEQFCVAIIRTSPSLMAQAVEILQDEVIELLFKQDEGDDREVMDREDYEEDPTVHGKRIPSEGNFSHT